VSNTGRAATDLRLGKHTKSPAASLNEIFLIPGSPAQNARLGIFFVTSPDHTLSSTGKVLVYAFNMPHSRQELYYFGDLPLNQQGSVNRGEDLWKSLTHLQITDTVS